MVTVNNEWRSLHPLSPVLRSGLVVLFLCGIVVAHLRDQILNELLPQTRLPTEDEAPFDDAVQAATQFNFTWIIMIACVLGVLLLVVVSSWLSWRFTKFRVTQTTVELRHGWLFRGYKEAALTRIQGVDLKRPLLARILGLTAIECVTAAGVFKLEYLAHGDAVALRQELLCLLAEQDSGLTLGDGAQTGVTVPELSVSAAVGAAPGGQLAVDPQILRGQGVEQAAAADSPAVRLSASRFVASYFLNLWLFVWVGGGAILSVLARFVEQLDFSFLLPLVIPVLVVILTIAWKTFNSTWGTVVHVKDGELRLSGGLTTTKTESIPFDRIAVLALEQPLLWRFLKWYRVRVYTAGGAMVGIGRDYTVLPVATAAQLIALYELLLAERVSAEQFARAVQLERLQPLRFNAARRAFPLLARAPRRESAELIRVAQGVAVQQPELLVLRSGILLRRAVFVKLERAQGVSLRVGLCHRLLGLAQLVVHSPVLRVRCRVSGLRVVHARVLFAEVNDAIIAALKQG